MAAAQHEYHNGPAEEDSPVNRPRVLLDKNPRIVWYQLDRLSNERLLLVERAFDHPKYKPVWEALLLRPGLAPQDKVAALDALVALNASNPVTQLLEMVGRIDPAQKAQRRVASQLTAMLLQLPVGALRNGHAEFRTVIVSENSLLQKAGFAALIQQGHAETSWALAQESAPRQIAFLQTVQLLPTPSNRAELRSAVIASLEKTNSQDVRRAAVEALAHVPTKYEETFRIVTQLLETDELESAAVETLLRIPKAHRPAESASRVVEWAVRNGEATPAAARTSDEFLRVMQLADESLVALPIERARELRQRLGAIAVRVVRIRTVKEEMRYDMPHFAVQAGRPVQVILQNDDLMPHNLVITTPGAIREVAEQAEQLSPEQTRDGKQYVPESDRVLHATAMVPAGQQYRLTFDAPSAPGEYPFVCTFPRHWMRMYGVMVVVEDLDAWLQNPQEPTDPLGNNRSFVQNWKLSEFDADLTAGLRGRNASIGQRLFQEATCAQCHKIGNEGGAVGPALDGILGRFKGDQRGILREIIDPSYRVEPKYSVHVIITGGKVISGIVTAQDKTSVTIVSNPENPRPEKILREEIDEMEKTSTSLMPKGLLDRFTKDEILEILSYATSHS